MNNKTKVLVVDDSALVRQILAEGLAGDPQIEVVGTASDPYDARDQIVRLSPDVLTLDVEMPRMDGVEFLRRLLPQKPIPVVMVSSLTQRGKAITLQALEAGAVDFVAKPTSNLVGGLPKMLGELRAKVKMAANARVAHLERAARPRPRPTSGALAETTDKVVVIGASTGGTEAIREVLGGMPPTGPGIVIVQHMPKDFTAMFAHRLDELSPMRVREAADGDRVVPGLALIAPGDRQCRIKRCGGQYRIELGDERTVSGHCPSVDVMMTSAAKAVGPNAVGVMLTGMGSDGAEGMLAMRGAGARTLAQDEATSVVFGMPKAAHANGGAERLVPLREVAASVALMLRSLGGSKRATSRAS